MKGWLAIGKLLLLLFQDTHKQFKQKFLMDFVTGNCSYFVLHSEGNYEYIDN
jgi:hypothetical protein